FKKPVIFRGSVCPDRGQHRRYIQYRNEAIKSGDKAGQIINIPIARPYTEIGFCSFHGLGEKYIREMKASLDKNDLTEDEQELSWVLSCAIARCWAQKFEGAAVG